MEELFAAVHNWGSTHYGVSEDTWKVHLSETGRLGIYSPHPPLLRDAAGILTSQWVWVIAALRLCGCHAGTLVPLPAQERRRPKRNNNGGIDTGVIPL